MQLKDRLRELRQKHNLTLKELAAMTDLSYTYLSSLEHGRAVPSLKSAAALAEAFNLSLVDMLTGVDLGGEPAGGDEMPAGLRDLLDSDLLPEGMDEDWVNLLRNLQVRGTRPGSMGDYWAVYVFLRRVLGE
jgi:transcriptional regulator with XRE-family HTH domain